jgi:oligo-1,6-glucosidase
MANAPFASLDDLRDVESLNHHAQAVAAGADPAAVLAAIRPVSRDNARTPVQWDATEHAGFTTGTPWIAVNPDHTGWNAEAQRADPRSVLAHHRALVALRHTSATVRLGDFTMLLPDHDDVYAFTRALDGDTLLVVCNVGPTPYDLAALLPEAVGAELVLGNLADPDPARLGAWDARVLRLAQSAAGDSAR